MSTGERSFGLVVLVVHPHSLILVLNSLLVQEAPAQDHLPNVQRDPSEAHDPTHARGICV